MADSAIQDPLALYLRALYRDQRDGFVEVARQPTPGGPWYKGDKGGVFVPLANLDDVARMVRHLGARENIWLGVLPRQRDARSGEPAGTREHVPGGRVLWVDLDNPPGEAGRERLASFSPPPHLIVSSGRGNHAYWLLDEPLERMWLARANRRLAHALGADRAATDPTRILRPPGSRNFDHGEPLAVELVHVDRAAPYRARDVVGQLADPPLGRTGAGRRVAPGVETDPLRQIAPPEYFRELAGVDVGDGGEVICCPLPDHDDQEPSCYVYGEAEAGWFCYGDGCGRGGSIYDLAAHLSNREPRGHDFVVLRAELSERFGVEAPTTVPRAATASPVAAETAAPTDDPRSALTAAALIGAHVAHARREAVARAAGAHPAAGAALATRVRNGVSAARTALSDAGAETTPQDDVDRLRDASSWIGFDRRLDAAVRELAAGLATRYGVALEAPRSLLARTGGAAATEPMALPDPVATKPQAVLLAAGIAGARAADARSRAVAGGERLGEPVAAAVREQLNGRWTAARDWLAVTVDDPRWWQGASLEAVAAAWELTSSWEPHSPAMRGSAATMRHEVAGRLRIDLDDPLSPLPQPRASSSGPASRQRAARLPGAAPASEAAAER